MNKKILLDSSAVIALIKKESGYHKIEDILAFASISVINLTEIISVLVRLGVPEKETISLVSNLVPQIMEFSTEIAIETGLLITRTTDYGLSFGDRACIATGIHHDMKIYTADRAWSNLNMENIEIIR